MPEAKTHTYLHHTRHKVYRGFVSTTDMPARMDTGHHITSIAPKR